MYVGKSFIESIREELDNVADRLESPSLSFTSHIFSDKAITGRRLCPMPNLHSGTNIALGFEAMTKSVRASSCEHCIIVFVSDGADSPGNEAKRNTLQKLPCRSTLLTVAVGEGFPTSLVVDDLRIKYHTFGGDSIPLVIPLSNKHSSVSEMQEEIKWITSQLEEIILARGEVQELSMEELSATLDINVIFSQCKRWYNAVTIKCMSKAAECSLQDKINMVKETRDKFNQAEVLMKKQSLCIAKPLPSNLKARRSLFLLTTLRERINKLLEQLNKGNVLDQLTDMEKQEYLSFGNKAGRFLSTSIRYCLVICYHPANWGTDKPDHGSRSTLQAETLGRMRIALCVPFNHSL
jgi:hypothetical protein